MDPLKTPTRPLKTLPEDIAAWIGATGGDHALLLITIDGYARPHVAMLARDEVAVVSPTHLRITCGEGSQTAVNLGLRASATIALYDADLACVIKTHVESGPRPLLPGLTTADLAIEDVRLDRPAPSEKTARLVSGLRFEGRARRDDIARALAENPTD